MPPRCVNPSPWRFFFFFLTPDLPQCQWCRTIKRLLRAVVLGFQNVNVLFKARSSAAVMSSSWFHRELLLFSSRWLHQHPPVNSLPLHPALQSRTQSKYSLRFHVFWGWGCYLLYVCISVCGQCGRPYRGLHIRRHTQENIDFCVLNQFYFRKRFKKINFLFIKSLHSSFLNNLFFEKCQKNVKDKKQQILTSKKAAVLSMLIH